MTKKIDIGASISSRTDASSTVETIFGAEDFPCTLNVKNHTVTRLVLPELKALDVPGLGSVEAVFYDIGVLKRVVSSLAQISRLNRFSCIATISSLDLLESQPEETEQAAPAAAPLNETPVINKQADDEDLKATVIEDLPGGLLLVAVGDVRFEVKKGQVRENGTLTAGGMTAYQAAKKLTTE